MSGDARTLEGRPNGRFNCETIRDLSKRLSWISNDFNILSDIISEMIISNIRTSRMESLHRVMRLCIEIDGIQLNFYWLSVFDETPRQTNTADSGEMWVSLAVQLRLFAALLVFAPTLIRVRSGLQQSVQQSVQCVQRSEITSLQLKRFI